MNAMQKKVLLVCLLLIANPVLAFKSGYRTNPGSTDVLKKASGKVDACFAESVTAVVYRVHAGDTLRVSVWHEQDMLQELLVRPDGGITFPLVGDVSVAGLTLEESQQVLKNRLAKFIPDAQVHITVLNVAGNAAYVVGKVNRPGPVVLSGDVSVVQALSVAGGATVYADTNEIRVLRQCDGKQRTFVVNYSDIEQGVNLGQNISLRSGDVVVVP